MVSGTCAECPRATGEALLRRAIERVGSLAGGLALQRRFVAGNETRPTPSATVSRRGVFSLLARPFHRAFRPKPANDRRKRLLRFMDQLGARTQKPPSGLFFDLAISPACTGCPVCEAVCPMAAIAQEKCPDSVVLRFDPLSCTGCDNCRAACPEGAITLSQRTRPLLPASTPEVVAMITLHPCPSCGAMVGGNRKMCLSCQGREGRLRLSGLMGR